MRRREAVSGHSATAWARQSERRTRWVRHYVLASSWPVRFGSLDLADWLGSPFGTPLAELTSGSDGLVPQTLLSSRHRTRSVTPYNRAQQPQLGSAISQTPAPLRSPLLPTSGTQNRTAVAPNTVRHSERTRLAGRAPASASRPQLTAWAGTVRELPGAVRPDIRAKMGLEARPAGQDSPPPLTIPRIASAAVGVRADAGVNATVARIAGQPLFAPGTATLAPGASGWKSAMGTREIDFAGGLPTGQNVGRRSEARPARRASTDDAATPVATGVSPERSGRRGLSNGWDTPIAPPQPGFVPAPAQAVLARETELPGPGSSASPRFGLAMVPDVNAPLSSAFDASLAMLPGATESERGAATRMFVPAIEASSFATAEAAGLLPSGVDRAIYPSFPSPRASEKLFFTGPETSRPAPDATRRPLIDAIDFAEQLRVALIEDARRHGIEV